MKRYFLFFVMFLLTLHLSAQQERMNFMGVNIGTDTQEVADKKLADQGFAHKIYDPTYDVYSYQGTYQGKEACVYLSIMDNAACRLVFRVSDGDWEQLKPLAANLAKQLKKEHPKFKVKENDLQSTDLRYRMEMTYGLDRILFFNIQRDNEMYDVTLTFE